MIEKLWDKFWIEFTETHKNEVVMTKIVDLKEAFWAGYSSGANDRSRNE
jgi:hypothetical protein